jgi:PAS domain S-box-containing protein
MDHFHIGLSQFLFQHTHEGLVILNKNLDVTGQLSYFTIVELNPAFENLFNQTREELIGSNLKQIIPEFDIDEYKNVDGLINFKSDDNIEVFCIKQQKYFQISIIPFTPDQIALLVLDVTQEKEKEKTLKAEIVLKENEEKFRSLIEQSLDGIILIDEQGTIIEWNNGVEKISGYARHEAINFPYWDIQYKLLTYTPPSEFEYKEKIKKSIQSRLSSENTDLAPIFYEIKIKTKDGTIKTIQNHIFPIKFSKGNMYGIIVRDISHFKEIENRLIESYDEIQIKNKELINLNVDLAATNEQLQKSNDSLRQREQELREWNEGLQETVIKEVKKSREKDRIMELQSQQAAMGQMISIIAHQWRQPLNAIGLLVQDLKEAHKFKEFTEQYLDNNITNIKITLDYMSQTIDDFRNFFRIDKEKEIFSIHETIQKALKLMSASFNNHHIEIVKNIHEDLFIEGYPNEYSQVLFILLNNAKDALIANRQINPLVIITISSESDKSVVKIYNNGGNIPPHIKDKIFSPYFTTKDKKNGTGLGLYMAKLIIEKNMNGILEFENCNDGVEFRIEL